MFHYFITQIIRSLTVFGRTVRAFFVRRCARAVSFFRRITNVSRGAAKAANSAMQSVLSVSSNPSKREDYVETRRLLISKALILKIVLLLAAAVLLGRFLIWPFILSRFLTARFFVEDSRIEDWSGRVIVYADKKKTLPLYAGRLEDGVLQGRGKQYDGSGLLSYEGQFQDGFRSGSGVEYRESAVIYEGQFALDRREGSGTEYRDGLTLYEGQFKEGLYEGRGAKYDGGVLAYEGSFQGGVISGEGVSYYPDGTVAYKGQFAQNLYEGTGTAYDESGAVLYEGGFSAGLYNGEGVLTIAPGQKLEASFQQGSPEGVVKWNKDGKLYYEGDWAGSRPDGFGTLYGKSGTVLYRGQFSNGTLDGAWLLTLSAQDLRNALGTAKETAARDGGFLISSPALGLTALCSFQTDEKEPHVHSIYLAPPEENSDWVRLMPGDGNISMDNMDSQSANMAYRAREGVPVPSGTYRSTSAALEGGQAVALYGENADAVLVIWSLLEEAPKALDRPEDAPETLDEFLDALDQIADGAPPEEGAAPVDGETELLDVREALAGCKTADEAKNLVDRLLDWWVLDTRISAQKSGQSRLQSLLDEAKTALGSGTGSQSAVTALEQELTQSGWELEQSALELGKLEIGLDDPSQYALSELTASFDPAQVDAGELPTIAAAYARAVGRESEPGAAEIKAALVELTQARLNAQYAMERYEWCVQAAKSAAGNYAMGSGGKPDWYTAMSAQENAQAEIGAALAEVTRRANALNWTTGGWISRTFNWFPDIFTPLYEAEIPVEPQPQQDSEQSAQTPPAGEAPEEEAPAQTQEPPLAEQGG